MKCNSKNHRKLQRIKSESFKNFSLKNRKAKNGNWNVTSLVWRSSKLVIFYVSYEDSPQLLENQNNQIKKNTWEKEKKIKLYNHCICSGITAKIMYSISTTKPSINIFTIHHTKQLRIVHTKKTKTYAIKHHGNHLNTILEKLHKILRIRQSSYVRQHLYFFSFTMHSLKLLKNCRAF